MNVKNTSAISNVKLRVALTKFRISAHYLEIERGRYTNTTREDRICKLCKCHVETEYHFLLCMPLAERLKNQIPLKILL